MNPNAKPWAPPAFVSPSPAVAVPPSAAAAAAAAAVAVPPAPQTSGITGGGKSILTKTQEHYRAEQLRIVLYDLGLPIMRRVWCDCFKKTICRDWGPGEVGSSLNLI